MIAVARRAGAAVVGVAVAVVLLRGSGGPAFHDVAATAGLRFQHDNGWSGQYNLPEIMGAGGALLDYDGDGDLDVLLIQGRALVGTPSTATAATPRLFRNDLHASDSGAALRFTDVSSAAGFAAGDYGMGIAAGDYDNDGDPDVYLTNYGANRLYRNDRGRFTDVTRTAGAGLDDPRWSTSASFTDYDADGDLDLFVVNYVHFSIADNKVCSDPTGRRDFCGPLRFRPAPDRLFRNNGNGAFTDVSEPAGISAALGPGLGVVGADLDGDGRQDFYVANDATANHFWHNNGNGTFAEAALLAGLAFNAEGEPEGSMGIAVGDADEDGDPDLFVTNITSESHAFYENLGGGRFEDRRLPTGLGILTRPYTGFGTGWFDADNDGRLDLFVANGAVTILEALRGDRFPFRQKNQLLRNRGGKFEDASAEAGGVFALEEVSRGAAFGDVDNDGDVDLLVTNNNGPARLLLNDGPPAGSGFSVRLQGVDDNAQGLGARVGLVGKNGRTRWRVAHTDGSYLSARDPRVHFGGARTDEPVTLIVVWPRGLQEEWGNLRPHPGNVLTLRQHTGSPVSPLYPMVFR